MYFLSRFPKMSYSFDGKTSVEVVNILSAFFIKKIALNGSAFQLYSMNDGETIESISEKLYGSPIYYWVLLLNNDIVNPWFEISQTSDSIRAFTIKKYKNGIQEKLVNGSTRTKLFSSGCEGIHHFLNDNTNCICDDYDDNVYRMIWQNNPLDIPINILPITNIEYELEKNAENRNINVVDVGNLQKFIEDFSMMVETFNINKVK